MRIPLVALALVLACLAGCASEDRGHDTTSVRPAQDPPPRASSDPATAAPAALVMPDLIGLPSVRAGDELGDLGLGSDWGRPVRVRCGTRPRTVVRQQPAPGATVTADTLVEIRTAALDLDRFRGPCSPTDPLDTAGMPGADVALARTFYRFAADPSLGAPFAEEVWVGIAEGPTSTVLSPGDVGELSAWQVGTEYAEAAGPFSALDILALSGGYYELRAGIAATCPQGSADAPPALRGLRAISLTAPDDVTGACSEWWGVTLFLDARDRVRGVALRLGSP
ncbi:MAG TPA: PASTA domain-containing protein [Nocardioides sp.]|nr:PASTA domain-containing protein [Nocardioides sp.]